MTISNNVLTIFFKAFAFWGIFQTLIVAVNPVFFALALPKWGNALALGILLSLIMVGLSRLFLKYDDLTIDDLGMNYSYPSLKNSAIALVLGLIVFGLFYGVYYWLTPIAIQSIADVDILSALIKIIAVYIALSIMEEVVFRGYFLVKLETAVGIRSAIYITSLAFGLYHGITLDSITGPAVWGLVYGVLFYWSRGLAVPIGFHAGVNITQAIFNQKTHFVDGIWTIDIINVPTPFSIEQISVAIQILLLITGVALIEYYLRVVRPKRS